MNRRATELTFQAGTLLLDEANSVLPPIIRGEAFAVLRFTYKPYANIRTSNWGVETMNEIAGEVIDGWWHAIRTADGWRVFADDYDGLFHLKMKYPRY